MRAGLADRGAEGVPLGRADWDDLAGAIGGCDAAYVIAPNLHPAEPAYVEQVLDAVRTAGVERVVYHSVAWTVAELAAEAGVSARRTDVRRARGAESRTDVRTGAWLDAMFAYYDEHGLPVGTLPLRALLGR